MDRGHDAFGGVAERGGEQLLDEEGNSVASPHHGADEIRREVDPLGALLQHRLGLRGVEWLEVDRLYDPPSKQRGHQVGTGPGLLVPHGRHDQHRQPGEIVRQVLDHCPGLGVGPVHVLDDQERGRLRSRPLPQQTQQPLGQDHRSAVHGRVTRLTPLGNQRRQRGQEGRELRRGAEPGPGGREERLSQRSERNVCRGWATPTDQDGSPSRSGPVGELSRQATLADPGAAADHQHAAAHSPSPLQLREL